MPTSKPRISITLDLESIVVLDRFAALAGRPRASFISAMITAAIPEFVRAADVMELARTAPESVQRHLVESMSNATADAMGLIDGAIDQTAEVVRKAKKRVLDEEAREHAQKGPRLRGSGARAAGRVNPATDPRSLTGGSKC